MYIGSHGHDNLDNYNLILPSTTYLEKESTYMNLTGLIQKSGSLVYQRCTETDKLQEHKATMYLSTLPLF